jgi:hypothetical protein
MVVIKESLNELNNNNNKKTQFDDSRGQNWQIIVTWSVTAAVLDGSTKFWAFKEQTGARGVRRRSTSMRSRMIIFLLTV